MKKLGVRLGNWLTAEQSTPVWSAPTGNTLREKRDRAMLALLLACGLRRHEAVMLTLEHLQQREEHWAIVDLVGKGTHVRTVSVRDWVRMLIEEWLSAAGVIHGRIFRKVNKMDRAWGPGLTEKAVWHIVKSAANLAGIAMLAPHDLRRT
ncbi:tyrosine-type recombinase/integrase [Edaphobacter sp. HDX4]|uniref:tyrosine-type recombinase/integrase n=1 Tax=Edaphobacter sp. HDX4 TaxID=2794064 RepID=UPI002FE597AA